MGITYRLLFFHHVRNICYDMHLIENIVSDSSYIQNYWAFELCSSSGILKITSLLKVHLFPSSGDGEDMYAYLLRLAISRGSNGVGISPLTWGRKQIHFPKPCIF
jgi:hypothetical protein